MKEFEYYKPDTLSEARNLLVKHRGEAYIFNGGTDLIVRMREEITNPKVIIDIKGIEKLHEISYESKRCLSVGACVNLSEAAKHEVINEKYEILADAIHNIGSMQLRNRATMTGNICNASPLADSATPLLVLDTRIVICGKEGLKKVLVKDFITGVRKTILEIGEIVTAIEIPICEEPIVGLFQKMSRRKMVDLSTVCGTVARVNGEIRVALGAVSPTPVRARKTEEFLKDKELTDEVIKEASEKIVEDISPISDIRASKEYRLDMARLIVKRGLTHIRDRKLNWGEHSEA
ncbi:MAG: FAD binding domain-containing protein [Alkaliphilus sp.]